MDRTYRDGQSATKVARHPPIISRTLSVMLIPPPPPLLKSHPLPTPLLTTLLMTNLAPPQTTTTPIHPTNIHILARQCLAAEREDVFAVAAV